LFEINKGDALTIQLIHVIRAVEGRLQLTEFLNCFVKVKLAEIIDRGKAGRTSTDLKAITKLIDDLK